MALLIPLARVVLLLVKKLTVSGIIGNTQGVSNANNPPKKPSINILKMPKSDVFMLSKPQFPFGVSTLISRLLSKLPLQFGSSLVAAIGTTGVLPLSEARLNENSTSRGGKQVLSLQAIYVT